MLAEASFAFAIIAFVLFLGGLFVAVGSLLAMFNKLGFRLRRDVDFQDFTPIASLWFWSLVCMLASWVLA